ncbi:MAG: hypothetical protein ABF335_09740 [Alphaproteobacteria bacterium]
MQFSVADYSPISQQFENGEYAIVEIEQLLHLFPNSLGKLKDRLSSWQATLHNSHTPPSYETRGRHIDKNIIAHFPIYASLAQNRVGEYPLAVCQIQRLFLLALLLQRHREKFKDTKTKYSKRFFSHSLNISDKSWPLASECWNAIEKPCLIGDWHGAINALSQVALKNPSGRQTPPSRDLDSTNAQNPIELLEDIQRVLELFRMNRIRGFRQNKSNASKTEKIRTGSTLKPLATKGHNLRLEKRYAKEPVDTFRPEEKTEVIEHLIGELNSPEPTHSGAAAIWICTALTGHKFDHILDSFFCSERAGNPKRHITIKLVDENWVAEITMRKKLHVAKVSDFDRDQSDLFPLPLPTQLFCALNDIAKLANDADCIENALNAILIERQIIRHNLRVRTRNRFTETRLRNTIVHAILHRTYDLSLCQLLTAERLETSDASLNYIGWRTNHVQDQWLGTVNAQYPNYFTFPTKAFPNHWIGSQIAAVLAENNPQIGAINQKATQDRPGPKTLQQWADILNQLSSEAAQSFLIATTHRGTYHFSNITARDIALHRQMALTQDKQVALEIFRRPTFFNETTAVRLVRYRNTLLQFRRYYEKHTPFETCISKNVREKIANAIDGLGPLFLRFEVRNKSLTTANFDIYDVWGQLIAPHFSDPKLHQAKSLRHTFSTKMRQFGLSPIIVETALGHLTNPPILGENGRASPSEFLEELSPALDKYFEWHGFKLETFKTAGIKEEWVACSSVSNLFEAKKLHEQTLKEDAWRLVGQFGGPLDASKRTAHEMVERTFQLILSDENFDFQNVPDKADLLRCPPDSDGKTIIPVAKAKTYLIQMCNGDLNKLRRSINLFRHKLREIELEKNAGGISNWKITRPHYQHWIVGAPVQFTAGRFLAEAQAHHIRSHLLNQTDVPNLSDRQQIALLIAMLICFSPIKHLDHLNQVLEALPDAITDNDTNGLLLETKISFPEDYPEIVINELFVLSGPALLVLCRLRRLNLQIPKSALSYNATLRSLLPPSMHPANSKQMIPALLEIFSLVRLFEMPGLVAETLESDGVTRELTRDRYINIHQNNISASPNKVSQCTSILEEKQAPKKNTILDKPKASPIEHFEFILNQDRSDEFSNLAEQRMHYFNEAMKSGILSENNVTICSWLTKLCKPTANQRKLNSAIEDDTVVTYFQRARPLLDLMQELDDGEWPTLELTEKLSLFLSSKNFTAATKENYISAIQRFCTDSKLPKLFDNSVTNSEAKLNVRAEFMSDAEIELVEIFLSSHFRHLPDLCRPYSPSFQVAEMFRLSSTLGARRGELIGSEIGDIWKFEACQYVHIHSNRKRGVKTDNAVRLLRDPGIPCPHPFKADLTDYAFERIGNDAGLQLQRLGNLIRIISNSDSMRLHSNRHKIGSEGIVQAIQSEHNISQRLIELESLAHRLGHSDITVTRDSYCHLNSLLYANYSMRIDDLSLGRISVLSAMPATTVRKAVSRATSKESNLNWDQQLVTWCKYPKVEIPAKSYIRAIDTHKNQTASTIADPKSVAKFVIHASKVGFIKAAGEHEIPEQQLLRILDTLESHSQNSEWEWISAVDAQRLKQCLNETDVCAISDYFEIGKFRRVARDGLDRWLNALSGTTWPDREAQMIVDAIVTTTWQLGAANVQLSMPYRRANSCLKMMKLPFISRKVDHNVCELVSHPDENTSRKTRSMMRLCLMAIKLATI